MNRVLIAAATVICLASPMRANAQQRRAAHPGAEPYIPTRIDWLTTTLQASLRTEESKFTLNIANSDSETILILVRYRPDVDREIMNLSVDAARQVIRITAKSYGWNGWLKVREDIQMKKAGE